MDEQVVIRGTVVGTRYHDGRFGIVTFRMVGNDGRLGEAVTVKGQVPSTDREQVVECRGRWTNHPTYGRQFEAIASFPVVPTTPEALGSYLARSQRIKGVGPAKAALLVERFGSQLATVLESQPERLAEVRGISPELAQSIHQAWKQEYQDRPTEIWLAERNISQNYARRIIATFGAQTTQVLSENPYRLTEVERIGFRLADQFAAGMGWTEASPERNQAGVTHLLEEAVGKGDAFLYEGQLAQGLAKLTGASVEAFREALEACVSQGRVVQELIDPNSNTKAVYLPKFYNAENQLAKRVAELKAFPHKVPNSLDSLIADANALQPLSDQQVAGIRAAFENHISIVTGGPGTGKTTLVRNLIQVAQRAGKKVVLAAPTGRAAKRLSEVTGQPAVTIHRLLEFEPIEGRFRRNRQNPIDADVLIIDEGSMMELLLARSAFDAVPDTCSLVIIGDHGQLPAIGPGMVLKDLIMSQMVHTTQLSEIFRQAAGSRIIVNAHRISAGYEPQFPETKGIESDSYLVKIGRKFDPGRKKSVDNIDAAKETLIKLCKESIPTRFKVDPIQALQVLAPMRVGPAGIEELNPRLQEALNPNGVVMPIGGFRTGDRVMQLKNNYQLDVYNGDIGFVEAYDHEDKLLEVRFDDRVVRYSEDAAEDLELAYAQTIHKSQGSEYPIVVIFLAMQHFVMLERNLLYTANTRARTVCIYLASPWAISTAVKNAPVDKRNALLAARIRGACQLEVV